MIPAKYPLRLVPGTTFGPYVILAKDVNGDPVDLTGCTVFAEVRLRAGASRVILDLNPSVTDGPAGEITIPAITDEDTFNLRFVHAKWSLIIQDPSGARKGPFIEDKFIIKGTPTHPAEA
jgi:hypothetical protein